MLENSEKLILSPISVNWMVSPSVSAITLTCWENDAAQISFNAFLGQHSSEGERLLTTKFSGIFRCCMFTSFSDGQVIPEDNYDWHLVPGRKKQEESISDYVSRVAYDWKNKGTCPNPRFYEILNSPITLKYPNLLQHFLIVGADSYVEIVAKSWELV